MTLADHIDTVTPDNDVRVSDVREGIEAMRECIRQLVRARVDITDFLHAARDEYIRQALIVAKGNRSKAALMIGVSRNTIGNNSPLKKQPARATSPSLRKAGER